MCSFKPKNQPVEVLPRLVPSFLLSLVFLFLAMNMFFRLMAEQLPFFITIPFGSLLYSLLARYSEQVLPSIIAHTLINAIAPILVYNYLH